MDLNERLNRFRLQQERCLSGMAAAKASSALRSSQRSATAVWRFSDDTARLQEMNSVRTSPVGAQMALVIKRLKETRRALTARQINEATYVDVEGNGAVLESLIRNNPKVRFDGTCFSYKPTNDVKGKCELLSLIRSFRDGLPVSEVEDAYPSVMEDLQALKSSGDIYLLSTMGSKQDIAYPNDPRSRMDVDGDLKKLFHEIKLPRDMVDIEKELRRNGVKPATDTAKRRAAAQILGKQPKPKKARRKQRGITSRTKITNAHLPGLFDLPMDSRKTSRDGCCTDIIPFTEKLAHEESCPHAPCYCPIAGCPPYARRSLRDHINLQHPTVHYTHVTAGNFCPLPMGDAEPACFVSLNGRAMFLLVVDRSVPLGRGLSVIHLADEPAGVDDFKYKIQVYTRTGILCLSGETQSVERLTKPYQAGASLFVSDAMWSPKDFPVYIELRK